MKYKPGEKFVVEIKEGYDMRMPMYKLEQIGALVPECGLDKLPQLVTGSELDSYNKGLEAWENRPTLTANERYLADSFRHGWFKRGADGLLWWRIDTLEARRVNLEMQLPDNTKNMFSFITAADKPWSIEELRKLEVRNE